MSNVLAISCPPAREISDADLVDELAEHLVTGRCDVSDPEDCFEFLLKLDVCRPKKLCDVFERALYAAGQIYIHREMSRKT